MAMPGTNDARLYYRCAAMRFTEASALLELGHTTGAYYLAGYVVECMLKALLVESQPGRFRGVGLLEPKKIGHDISGMLELYREGGGSPPPGNVARAPSLVDGWSSEIRYDPRIIKLARVEAFLRAVEDIFRWVDRRL
jgi:HEPN domain-containing protein